MNNLLSLITTTILFYLSGRPYSLLIGKQTFVEHLGLSFLLGSGLSTFFWFLAYLLGFPFSITSLVTAVLIVILIGSFLKKILNPKIKFIQLKFNLFDKYLIALILILSLIAIVISAYNPITAWDSLTMYDFRGQVIATKQTLTTLKTNPYYTSYPLMTSLTHAIVYLFKGTNPQPLYPLFFLSLISLIFSRLTIWINQRHGLIASLLLLTNQTLFGLSVIAYSNIPYTAFLVAAYLYAISPISKKHQAQLLISGLLLSLSTWVRSAETFWLIGIFIILWQGIRFQKKLFTLLSTSLVFILKFAWSHYSLNVYQKLNHQTTKVTSLISLETISKIFNNFSDIRYYLSQNIIYPYLSTWFLILATTPVFINLIKNKNKSPSTLRAIQLFIIIFLTFIMTLGGIAIFSTYYPTWDSIGGSAQRMIVFIVPLAIISANLSFHKLLKEKKL